MIQLKKFLNNNLKLKKDGMVKRKKFNYFIFHQH